MQHIYGRLGAALACAALCGCVDGPAGQGSTSGALAYAGDAGGLSAAAPALRLNYAASAGDAAKMAATAARPTSLFTLIMMSLCNCHSRPPAFSDLVRTVRQFFGSPERGSAAGDIA